MSEPCSTTPIMLHYANAILNALNIALVSWLAHRRMQADIREHRRNGEALDQKAIDGKRRNRIDSR